MSSPKRLTHTHNIYFFQRTNYIQLNQKNKRENPYSDFLETMDNYGQHLRKLGDEIDFGDSFLLWELIHLIKHISMVTAELIKKPMRPGYGDEDKIIKKLTWILSFIWVAFYKKNSVNKNQADTACDASAYVGLLFLKLGYSTIFEFSISNIKSIIKSYCEVANPIDQYVVGDLFAHLYGLKLYIIKLNNEDLNKKIEIILDNKPESLPENQWNEIQEKINLRKHQLEERLSDRNGISNDQSFESLLQNSLMSI